MTENTPVDQPEANGPPSSGGRGRTTEPMYFDEELGTIIASADLTARYFGVTRQTLSNWGKNGCPKHKYGYYDIKAVTDYRIRAAGLMAPPEDERDLEKMTIDQQKKYFEQRLKAAQAESAELRTAVMRGDYLKREQVVGDLKQFAVVLKRSLQGLGKKISRDVASQLGPGEARRFDRLITDTIEDAQRQLSVEGVYHAGRD